MNNKRKILDYKSDESLYENGFPFLKNPENYSEKEILKMIENTPILSGIFLQYEFEEDVIFNFFKKSSVCFEAFYHSQPYLFSHDHNNTNMVDKVLNEIIFYSDLENEENKKAFLNLLSLCKKLSPNLNNDQLRVNLVLKCGTEILEYSLNQKIIELKVEEDLKGFLFFMNPDLLQCFLDNKTEFYIEYGKEKGNLGFGHVFHPMTEKVEEYFDIVKEKFEHHPDYNEKEWIWGIFNHLHLQNSIMDYHKFSQPTKNILTQFLEQYPEFFTRSLTCTNPNIQKVNNFLELLLLYQTTPLLDIYQKQQNEIKLQKTLKSNQPKPSSLRF